jgi:hypothetical protein
MLALCISNNLQENILSQSAPTIKLPKSIKDIIFPKAYNYCSKFPSNLRRKFSCALSCTLLEKLSSLLYIIRKTVID